jgi:hypothetical protein
MNVEFNPHLDSDHHIAVLQNGHHFSDLPNFLLYPYIMPIE